MDSNKTFLELWQEFKQFASWLTSSRAPQRFQDFRGSCLRMGLKVISIPLPNDTRVQGLIMTIQALMRCKWAMDHYVALTIKSDAKFKKRYPEEDKWELLAQYEGILTPLKQVAFSLQSDEPGASSAALLEIYCSYFTATTMCYKLSDKYGGVACLTIKKGSERQWDARTAIDDLDEFRDTIKFDDLKPGPRLLIRRILAEYKHYLMDHDEDSIKAVCCNPLLANVFENMFVQFGVFDQDNVRTCRQIIIKDMVAKFSNKHMSRIGAALAKQNTNERNELDSAEEDNTLPKTVK